MRVPGVPYVQGRNSYVDRDGRKFGIAIHNTSNNASDTAEASYAQRRTDGVSSHFYCDADSVTQSLDTEARAGHAGSNTGNENAISVEITGANAWSRSTWLASVAWDELGRVLAYVCTHYGIAVRRASVAEMQSNPKVKAFYSHDDMRRAWGGTDHTDPGPNFPWDRLFQAVNAAIDPEGSDEMTAVQVESQAFNDLIYAVDALLKGENVAARVNPDGTTSVARVNVLALQQKAIIAGNAAVIEAIQSAGGDIETAAILEAIDAAAERVARKNRDAVADLGEGGSTQVRADA